ncbi:MAG: type II toxin-antitoxin system VapC family toxin [Terracidiphilus sp.]|jgi:predicted nucleic-acid-binding protein
MMTGIDTNILARFFTQDDPEQSRRADEFLQTLTPESPGFLSLVSLAELMWLLRCRYGTSKAQLIEYVKLLLSSSELVLESQAAVDQAIHLFAAGKADFADCLIERSGHLAGCGHTVTFDEGASRFAGMKLL